MNSRPRARVGITLGDPRGIGHEVAVAALADSIVFRSADYTFIGPDGLIPADFLNPSAIGGTEGTPGSVRLESIGRWYAGGTAVEAGRLAGLAITRAIEMAQASELDAVVTAPIDKAAFRAAGWQFPGHTEMFQEMTGVPEVAMMMAAERTRLGGPLRVVLATTHLALRAVPDALSESLLVGQAILTRDALRDWWGLQAPRLALCAFNPHASDAGLFGDEEARVYEPAISRLRAYGLDVAGPIPADTVFTRGLRGEFDVVIAPYHDVGMAPFKTVSFGAGVNVTLGLPFPRTSPDHGTALDIAGSGRADPSSMIEAILLAVRLAERFDTADKPG